LANHVSALKRARQDIKKRDANRAQKSTMRTAIKCVNEAVVAGDQNLANEAMVKATSLIARAGKKGILHANTARSQCFSSKRYNQSNQRLSIQTNQIFQRLPSGAFFYVLFPVLYI